ncbi:BA14K family protein [Gellertiella hungarica]|uniref:Lectin-like protein BA14k n=1 Tax=Gellertiella hungarica TaxID=1572859 RepID=A0A7W6NMI7_9HYPH|nr:BA14K family protein [Gellertiella hungarica]MBB4066427.1 hypothetical protein [Gellertiella hungarica]
MLIRSKLAMAMALSLGILAPDMALSMPRGVTAGDDSLVVKTGGIVCDLNGCRTYETRRRIYVEPPPPPYYDDPYYYDDPPVYVRPRVQRRIYVEPPPVYRERVQVMPRAHVRWCLERYRSYNPRTDLYLARKNVYRRCISPYS